MPSFNGMEYEEGSLIDMVVKLKESLDQFNGANNDTLEHNGHRPTEWKTNPVTAQGRVRDVSVSALPVERAPEEMGQREERDSACGNGEADRLDGSERT